MLLRIAMALVAVGLAASTAAAERRAPATASVEAGRARSYYLYCLFQQALMRRDYSRALDYLEGATEADPKAPDLATELARAYLNMSEVERAEAEARRAVSLDPSSLDAHRLLADVYRQSLSEADHVPEALYERAAGAFAGLLALDPSDGEARLDLGRLHLSQGRNEEAAEILRDYVERDPNSIDGIRLLSQALARSGSPAAAMTLLRTAIARRPGAHELSAALAALQDAGGDAAGAAATLEGVVAAAPDQPRFRFALAGLYGKMGRHADAAAQGRILLRLLRAATSGPDRDAQLRAAHALLIEIAAAGGRLEEALAAAAAAEGDFPHDQRFTLKRAELLLRLGREPEAMAAIAGAEAREGAEPASARAGASDVFFKAGAQKERAGDLHSAETYLRRSIEFDPANHAALNYLGYMNAERGVNLEESLGLVREAVRLDGENGAYLDSLGWVLFRLGRYGEAEGPLSEAARLLPEEPVVHDHLGDVYWARGRRAEAVAAWEEALRRGIEDPEKVREKIAGATGAGAATAP